MSHGKDQRGYVIGDFGFGDGRWEPWLVKGGKFKARDDDEVTRRLA
jgi:hypothetical protein